LEGIPKSPDLEAAMRHSLLVVALLTFSSNFAFAQTIDGAAAGVRPPPAAHTEQALHSTPARQDSAAAQRSMAPYLLIGALAGGVVGFLLEEDFHDDFCTPGPGVTCSSSHDGIGVVIGAGLGALAGWIVYAVTAPGPAPSSSSPAPR
jgi:hypothetical protein